MASAEQVKALLKSRLDGDDQRFYSVAMQVAAHEARLGHGKLAEELRTLIDQAKRKQTQTLTIPIHRPQGDLAEILSVSYPKSRMAQLILDEPLQLQLQRIIRENRETERILAHGLSPRRKLMLVGPPGTGKTMSASVLAGELSIPLFQVRLDGLITKFLGETAAKLRLIFEATINTRGVYFFDEFDAIGSHRGSANDVGEIRRVLNSFLQMLEQDGSQSLIVAATNHLDILDVALFRRFDDVLRYELPDESQTIDLLRGKLGQITAKGVCWRRLSAHSKGLSHAEISRAADEVLKAALIENLEAVPELLVKEMIEERRLMRHHLLS